MDLRHQADLVPLHPIDDVHLPQRFGAVELTAADITHEPAQLLHTAGRGHGGMAYVVLDVECGVVDPIGVAQTEGNLDEPAAEDRGQLQS